MKKEVQWVEDENGCHICTSHHRNVGGYAKMSVNGKKVTIHRYLYEQNFGEIPNNVVVRHKCDNPNCINIEHLELGSQKENVEDMFERGRNPDRKGSNGGRAKLTEEDVIEIRRLLNSHNNRQIAKIFNVSDKCISNIRCGTTWKHI